MQNEQIVTELNQMITAVGLKKGAAAKHLGISPGYFQQITHLKLQPSPHIRERMIQFTQTLKSSGLIVTD